MDTYIVLCFQVLFGRGLLGRSGHPLGGAALGVAGVGSLLLEEDPDILGGRGWSPMRRTSR